MITIEDLMNPIIIASFVGIILGMVILIKIFRISRNLKSIIMHLEGHVSWVNSRGRAKLEAYKKIPRNSVFIKVNPVSGYYMVCLKEDKKNWKIYKTFKTFEEAADFAVEKAK